MQESSQTTPITANIIEKSVPLGESSIEESNIEKLSKRKQNVLSTNICGYPNISGYFI